MSYQITCKHKQPALHKLIALVLIASLLSSTGCVSNQPMLLTQHEVDPTDDIHVLHLKDSTTVEFPGNTGRYDNMKDRYYCTTIDSLIVPGERVSLASVVRHEITAGGVLLALGIIGGVLLVVAIANFDMKMKWEGDNGAR